MAGAKLLKTLTLFQVVVMGLAYLTPMAVFDTFAIVGDITDGRVATAYLLALGGILLTAFSYGHLVRRFPSAGSAYTYAQKVFHPYVGFMVGWSSLLDYMFMPMINILLAKIYLTAMFPTVEPWIFIFGLVTVMTFLNLRGIKLVANLNGFIVFIQIAIIVTFLGLIAWGLSHGEGAGTLMSSRPFHVESASMLPLFTGATIPSSAASSSSPSPTACSSSSRIWPASRSRTPCCRRSPSTWVAPCSRAWCWCAPPRPCSPPAWRPTPACRASST